MPAEIFTLDQRQIAALLRQCGDSKSLPRGKLLHRRLAAALDLRHHPFFSNLLILMYGKCSSLPDAWAVFHDLRRKNAFSWNIMISALSANGESAQAIHLFQALASDPIARPTHVSFVTALAACANCRDLQSGIRIHAQIVAASPSIASNPVVCCALVTMYGRCGSLADARKIFDAMPHKSIVAWSAMLAACARNPDQGGLPAAIDLYRRLLDAGIGADEYVFISVLDAAAKLGFLEEGKTIHEHALESGFDKHPDVAAAIVNMYGKLGRLDLAMEVFDKIAVRNMAAWNTAIAANASNGQFLPAFVLLWKMDLEGVRPEMVTLIEILAVCSWKEDLVQGVKIHERVCGCGWESNVVVGTSIVNMYGKCGRVKEAKRVFDRMPRRDVVTWNAMISAFAQKGYCKEAIDLYKEMDVQRNSSSFMSALAACASLGSLEEGKQIHANIIAEFSSLSHQTLETGVGNAVINMYGKCQRAVEAKQVFDSLKTKNVITWNATIAAFAQNGYFKDALDLYGSMIEGDSSLRPDGVTYVNALHACAGLGWIAQGRDLHSRIVASEWSGDAVVMNSVMSMFVRCGSPGEAKRVFQGFKNRSAVSWTVAIAATAQQGRSVEAVELFLGMVQEGLAPDSYAFAGFLFACSHGGLLDTGWSCFTSMRQDFGVDPGAEHYGCMIDLLGRAGRSNQAKELLLAMPFSPDDISWTASVSIR